jgi:hypothetical protein
MVVKDVIGVMVVVFYFGASCHSIGDLAQSEPNDKQGCPIDFLCHSSIGKNAERR